MKLAKSLVVQLTPLGVSNEDIQRFKFPTPNYWIINKKNKNNKNKNLSEKKNKGNDKIEDVGMQLTHNKIKDKLLCSWEFSYISFLLKKKRERERVFMNQIKGEEEFESGRLKLLDWLFPVYKQ